MMTKAEGDDRTCPAPADCCCCCCCCCCHHCKPSSLSSKHTSAYTRTSFGPRFSKKRLPFRVLGFTKCVC
jgi:hypothetical protein